jgi:Glyoxalase-like domain
MDPASCRLHELNVSGGFHMYVGSVVIDCNNFSAMFAFWSAALRYVPRDPPEDGWAVLQDPERRHVNVSLQRVPEPRVGKNRLHLDLYTGDQVGEVARLLELGAALHPRTPGPGDDFVTMLDPEGNLFDVIDRAGA